MKRKSKKDFMKQATTVKLGEIYLTEKFWEPVLDNYETLPYELQVLSHTYQGGYYENKCKSQKQQVLENMQKN